MKDSENNESGGREPPLPPQHTHSVQMFPRSSFLCFGEYTFDMLKKKNPDALCF